MLTELAFPLVGPEFPGTLTPPPPPPPLVPSIVVGGMPRLDMGNICVDHGPMGGAPIVVVVVVVVVVAVLLVPAGVLVPVGPMHAPSLALGDATISIGPFF